MKTLMLKKILEENKPLNLLSQEEYQKLVAAGLLWDKYYNATGDPKMDLDCFVTIGKLIKKMQEIGGQIYHCKYPEENSKRQELGNQIVKLYSENFLITLKNEGLNEETARIIESICYEHGHSAGYSEVVNYSYEFVNFAKRIIEANK
jgi:hypothetical protein